MTGQGVKQERVGDHLTAQLHSLSRLSSLLTELFEPPEVCLQPLSSCYLALQTALSSFQEKLWSFHQIPGNDTWYVYLSHFPLTVKVGAFEAHLKSFPPLKQANWWNYNSCSFKVHSLEYIFIYVVWKQHFPVKDFITILHGPHWILNTYILFCTCFVSLPSLVSFCDLFTFDIFNIVVSINVTTTNNYFELLHL